MKRFSGGERKNGGAEAPGAGPRGAILRAAAAEFAEEGFEGARVDAIARRARVNKALLYYYVGGKEALYTAVLLDTLAAAAPRVEAACAAVHTPEERLRAYAEAFESLAEERPHLPRVLLRELASGGQHIPPAVLKRFLGVFAILRESLEAGRAEGRFRPLDPLTAHVLLVGGTMLLRAVRPLRRRAAKAAALRPPEEGLPLADLVSDVVLNGLCLPPLPPPAEESPR